MPDLTWFWSFDWLEGSRAFSIAFGTLTSAACLSLALPILYWCLPASRKWIFGARDGRSLALQVGYGVLSISMGFADALCRYIPHRRLGNVHEVFFLTTISLIVILGPRVYPLFRRPALRAVGPFARVALALILVVLVVLPATSVANAFGL